MPAKTPFLDLLWERSLTGRKSFHMPGSREGRAFPPDLAAHFTYLETTELNNTGDINAPDGVTAEALDLAAKYFGSGFCRFFTVGTTAANLTMLSAVCSPGSTIILSPLAHISIIHSLALFDLKPVFLPLLTSHDEFDPMPRLDMAGSLEVIAAHPEAACLLITTPNYFGYTENLKPIADACHKQGFPLLVDEAHGNHLCLDPEVFPPSALAQGADIVVQSAHKTLPTLNSASYLHASQDSLDSGRVAAWRLNRAQKIFQTSSPSFPVAASLDYARAYMEDFTKEQLNALLQRIDDFRQKTNAVPGFRVTPVAPWFDPIRLALNYAESGVCRRDILKAVNDAGIDVEFSDLERLCLIVSLDQPAEDFEALTAVCEKLARECPHDGTYNRRNREWTARLDQEIRREKVFEMSIREALLGTDGERLMPEELDSRMKAGERFISLSPLAPYPPGIPIVWPGQKLERAEFDLLMELKGEGLSISGLHDGAFLVLSY